MPQKDSPRCASMNPFVWFCDGKKGLVFLLLQGDYLLAAVETASLANTMCQYHFIAFGIGALYHTGHSELGVVGSSLVSACLRSFSLRYCHDYTSLGSVNQ